MPLDAGAVKSHWQGVLKIGVLILLIVAANLLADRVVDLLKFELLPSNEEAVHRIIMVSAALYAVLLAIPFVPGAEIGLTLIGMLGPPIVFLVYVCTVAGLMLGFVAGRLISVVRLTRLLDDLRLTRASRLLAAVEPLSRAERLSFIVSRGPKRFLPFLLRHRYLALAALFNLPGNFLIGGGGGIAMVAGISGIYSLPGFLVTVAVAVAPVPVAILVFGTGVLPG